jgi:hypothetical protein
MADSRLPIARSPQASTILEVRVGPYSVDDGLTVPRHRGRETLRAAANSQRRWDGPYPDRRHRRQPRRRSSIADDNPECRAGYFCRSALPRIQPHSPNAAAASADPSHTPGAAAFSMGGRTVAATLNYSESARDVTATLPLTIRIYNVTRRVKIQDIALEGIDVQYCAGVVIRRSKVLRSGSKRALEASQSASIRARMWPASVGNAVG